MGSSLLARALGMIYILGSVIDSGCRYFTVLNSSHMSTARVYLKGISICHSESGSCLKNNHSMYVQAVSGNFIVIN
jgi:hypothetical protein